MTLATHDRPGVIARNRTKLGKASAVGVSMVALFFGLGGNAFAAGTVDPGVSTAITDGFGGLTALVVGVLATALFAITLATLGIRMGVRWLRKGASS